MDEGMWALASAWHTLPTVKWFGAQNQNLHTGCSIGAQKQTLQTVKWFGAHIQNLHTVCSIGAQMPIFTMIVQLVHKIKICTLFVQLVHKMQIATHCGQNQQTTCQTQVSSVMRNVNNIIYSKLSFPHWREYAEYPQNLPSSGKALQTNMKRKCEKCSTPCSAVNGDGPRYLGCPQVARPISLLTSSL